MFIIKYKWIFLSISFILMAISLFFIFTFGLKKGIDFTGGTEITISYNNFKDKQDDNINILKNNLSQNGFSVKNVSIKENIDNTSIVFVSLNGELLESKRDLLKNIISFNNDINYQVKYISENVIGPSIGKELAKKSIISIVLVFIIIITFLYFSFKNVSEPVSSFKYGLITIFALLHDVLISVGVYAFLGYKYGVEIDTLFVLSILTIIGISISDTIVIFDRIRENLKNRKSNETFVFIVGKSLSQSLLRSLNTSLTTIAVLIVLFVFGPESIHYFSLVLLIGLIVGTYSSIFFASPVLVLVEKFQKKRK